MSHEWWHRRGFRLLFWFLPPSQLIDWLVGLVDGLSLGPTLMCCISRFPCKISTRNKRKKWLRWVWWGGNLGSEEFARTFSGCACWIVVWRGASQTLSGPSFQFLGEKAKTTLKQHLGLRKGQKKRENRTFYQLSAKIKKCQKLRKLTFHQLSGKTWKMTKSTFFCVFIIFWWSMKRQKVVFFCVFSLLMVSAKIIDTGLNGFLKRKP